MVSDMMHFPCMLINRYPTPGWLLWSSIVKNSYSLLLNPTRPHAIVSWTSWSVCSQLSKSSLPSTPYRATPRRSCPSSTERRTCAYFIKCQDYCWILYDENLFHQVLFQLLIRFHNEFWIKLHAKHRLILLVLFTFWSLILVFFRPFSNFFLH